MPFYFQPKCKDVISGAEVPNLSIRIILFYFLNGKITVD